MEAAASSKWPNVPACYEWLSLDRRGNWRLQGERVSHAGLIDFLNRNYASDTAGNWFVQNGPQRVYVDLAATPWIYRLDADTLTTHTGQPAGDLRALYLDGDGNLLIAAETGPGLLDDRDLATFLAACTKSCGQPAGEADFLALLAGETSSLSWRGQPLTLLADDPAQHFAFVRQPRP